MAPQLSALPVRLVVHWGSSVPFIAPDLQAHHPLNAVAKYWNAVTFCLGLRPECKASRGGAYGAVSVLRVVGATPRRMHT
jgi:hypothetical protein